ncbi:hypothetical protein [Iodidimonas sp. SYSU 1G8]|uniref:hypothetical protein n=1 Tax=Iodidimonas sp. SYSU 1G8 TaxID=3133967 RepID=UPI0031FEAD7C
MTAINLALFFLICVVAAYPVVVGRRPDRAVLLDRMRPFRVLAGAAGLCLGVIQMAAFLPVLGLMLDHVPTAVVAMIVGLEIVLSTMLVYPPLGRRLIGKPAQDPVLVQAPLATLGIGLVAICLIDLAS